MAILLQTGVVANVPPCPERLALIRAEGDGATATAWESFPELFLGFSVLSQNS